ncbi:MAG: hypothetical protein WCR52_10610 [Bacteroidota bacterium]
MKSIRPLYEALGADGYYREHAETYENPHFPEIEALLTRNVARMDCTRVLDFSSGGGEVTQVLAAKGVSNIMGCDPYTYELYERNTGRPCMRHDFKDVVKNGLPEQYSVIISSFALHLCPPKDLFPLAWNLLAAAPLLVVLTPHKRPVLEILPGIELVWQDFVCTERGKQVRLKAYQYQHHFQP